MRSGISLVESPPCNAGDLGSIPGQGTRIPHALEQAGLCFATTEPKWCKKKIPHHTLQILHATTKTQCSQINKYSFSKNNRFQPWSAALFIPLNSWAKASTFSHFLPYLSCFILLFLIKNILFTKNSMEIHWIIAKINSGNSFNLL